MLRVDPDLDLRFHLQRVELQWYPLPWGKLMLGFERARMLPLILPPMPLSLLLVDARKLCSSSVSGAEQEQ